MYLDPVIVGVSHHNLLFTAETEAVWGVELSLARPKLPELASDLQTAIGQTTIQPTYQPSQPRPPSSHHLLSVRKNQPILCLTNRPA